MIDRQQDGSMDAVWPAVVLIAVLFITSVPPLDVSSSDESVPSNAPTLPFGPVSPHASSAFIRNDGQLLDDDVLFYLPAPNGMISILESEVIITMFETASGLIPDDASTSSPDPDDVDLWATINRETMTRGCTLQFTFDGSNTVAPSPGGCVRRCP